MNEPVTLTSRRTQRDDLYPQAAGRGRSPWEALRAGAGSGLILPFLLFISLPLAALVLRVSPARFWASLAEPEVQGAVSLSLGTATAATLVTLIFGTPVAYWLATERSPLRHWVDTLVDLPAVLPPAVAGVALLIAFGRRGLLGGPLADLGIELPFTAAAVVMAQTFVAAPLYIKAAAVGFANVNHELKQAAGLDGATGPQIFRYVVLPLSGSALLSGAVTTWARAMGEFGATIIFAGNFPGRTQTMPLAIYLGFEIELTTAVTLSVILIGLSFLTLALVKGVLHRRIDGEA